MALSSIKPCIINNLVEAGAGWNPVLSHRKLLILQSDKSAKYAGFATSSYVEFTRDHRQIQPRFFSGDTSESHRPLPRVVCNGGIYAALSCGS